MDAYRVTPKSLMGGYDWLTLDQIEEFITGDPRELDEVDQLNVGDSVCLQGCEVTRVWVGGLL